MRFLRPRTHGDRLLSLLAGLGPDMAVMANVDRRLPPCLLPRQPALCKNRNQTKLPSDCQRTHDQIQPIRFCQCDLYGYCLASRFDHRKKRIRLAHTHSPLDTDSLWIFVGIHIAFLVMYCSWRSGWFERTAKVASCARCDACFWNISLETVTSVGFDLDD
jgi:hypothetical protein